VGLGLDQRGGRDDLTGRAEPALERVGADERVHERVVPQPLDRRHLALADRVNERDAREHGHAVELHRARAAVAFRAGDLRAGQAELLAQSLGERQPDRRVDLKDSPVHAQAQHATRLVSPKKSSS
jgi:hypothetical protein